MSESAAEIQAVFSFRHCTNFARVDTLRHGAASQAAGAALQAAGRPTSGRSEDKPLLGKQLLSADSGAREDQAGAGVELSPSGKLIITGMASKR